VKTSVGVQSGSVPFQGLERCVFALRAILREKFSAYQVASLEELAIIMRVESDSAEWGKDGLGTVRIMKNKGYILLEIYVGLRSLARGRRFVCEHVAASFRQGCAEVVRRALAARLDMDAKEFSAIADDVVVAFLSNEACS